MEGLAVEGEGGAASAVSVGGIWEGGELGPCEMVAVHGDEGCRWRCIWARGQGEDVEALNDELGEGGLAGAGDAADGDHCGCQEVSLVQSWVQRQLQGISVRRRASGGVLWYLSQALATRRLTCSSIRVWVCSDI